MLRKLKAGSTSQSLPLFAKDTTSTTGGGLGSLAYNTSGLAAKYRRQGDIAWTTINLVTMTLGTWTSGGFVADGGPVTGGYEMGIPDPALAAGAQWVEIAIYGAANMLPVLIFLELDAVDYQNATSFGVSNIGAIKAKTDNLPASPAAVGSAMTLTSAYDAAKTAAQAGNAMALTTGERTSVADALLARNAAGGANGGKTVAYYIQGGPAHIAFDVPGAGQVTVYDANGSVLNVGTYTTDVSASPVTSITPG